MVDVSFSVHSESSAVPVLLFWCLPFVAYDKPTFSFLDLSCPEVWLVLVAGAGFCFSFVFKVYAVFCFLVFGCHCPLICTVNYYSTRSRTQTPLEELTTFPQTFHSAEKWISLHISYPATSLTLCTRCLQMLGPKC